MRCQRGGRSVKTLGQSAHTHAHYAAWMPTRPTSPASKGSDRDPEETVMTRYFVRGAICACLMLGFSGTGGPAVRSTEADLTGCRDSAGNCPLVHRASVERMFTALAMR